MTTRKKAQAATRRGGQRNVIYLSVGKSRQAANPAPEPEKEEEEVPQPPRRTRRQKGEPKEPKEAEDAKEASDSKEKVQKRRGRQTKATMSVADLDKCTHLTVELISDNYSFGFRKAQSEEQAAESQTPAPASIDLATILENLRRGVYTSRKEWQSDVNSVWQNALTTQPVNSMQYMAAMQMKQRFAKMVDEMDMSEEELWLRKVLRQLQKLEEIDCS